MKFPPPKFGGRVFFSPLATKSRNLHLQRLTLILFFSLSKGLFAQEYNSALISVYIEKDLNENSGKSYPRLAELAHDPEFDLTALADSLEDYLSSGYFSDFPFKVLDRNLVINDPHYHEYESHYFEKEENEPVSVASGYKMFLLEQTDYHEHDADELFSVFPQINTFLSASVKFHLVRSNINKKMVEIKPEFKLHFWDYKKEDTHVFSKSTIYVSSLQSWDPITNDPDREVLINELRYALVALIRKLKESRKKMIQKVRQKLDLN